MKSNIKLGLLTQLNSIDSVMASEIVGMRHTDLLRSIERIKKNIDVADWRSLFVSGVYVDKQGKKRPNYLLSKKGFLLLASKFDDSLRLKIINRVEELEVENVRLLKVQNERLWDKEDRLDLIPKWNR